MTDEKKTKNDMFGFTPSAEEMEQIKKDVEEKGLKAKVEAAIQAKPKKQKKEKFNVTQVTVLDAEAGQLKALLGMSKGISSEDPNWIKLAHYYLKKVADLGKPFTSDNIWAAGLPKPTQPKNIGVIIRMWANAGYIVKTYVPATSEQPSRQGGNVTQWIKASAKAP